MLRCSRITIRTFASGKTSFSLFAISLLSWPPEKGWPESRSYETTGRRPLLSARRNSGSNCAREAAASNSSGRAWASCRTGWSPPLFSTHFVPVRGSPK